MRNIILTLTRSWSPVQTVLLSFLILIFSGASLLYIPIATTHGISFIDALFTSTSAVCVTGLVVLDTAKDFTLAGKIIIALLIQLGGLGIMTFSLAILSMAGGSLSIRWRFTFVSMYSYGKKSTPRNLLIRTVIYTFTIEAVIALILFLRLLIDFPAEEAIGHAVFHAISSFCNAGFSTFSDNLVSYRYDSVIIITICASIVTGGLGFIVLYEIFTQLLQKRNFTRTSLSIHSRVVLIMTFILIFGGTVIFYLLEKNFILNGSSPYQSFLVSLFQSITCRTAGFNSVPIENLRQSTLLIMIFLMYIGGSPGSIAGGIKTTTLAVLILLTRSRFKGQRQVLLWNRALDRETIESATTLVLLTMGFIFLSTFLLIVFHEFSILNPFLSALFEVVSAFGTVGLSMGATPHLSAIGKLIIIGVMYIGRLGPLTLILAFTSHRKNRDIMYPEENIMIG